MIEISFISQVGFDKIGDFWGGLVLLTYYILQWLILIEEESFWITVPYHTFGPANFLSLI